MIWHLKTFQTWYVWQIAFKTLPLQKRRISSKLHQNAIVALNLLAVWLIQCKTVHLRRNHITILQCQCQYITEWVELHHSCTIHVLWISICTQGCLYCLYLYVCILKGIHFVITYVFVNQSNDLGIVSALLNQMDFVTCRAWLLLWTFSLFWCCVLLCLRIGEYF